MDHGDSNITRVSLKFLKEVIFSYINRAPSKWAKKGSIVISSSRTAVANVHSKDKQWRTWKNLCSAKASTEPCKDNPEGQSPSVRWFSSEGPAMVVELWSAMLSLCGGVRRLWRGLGAVATGGEISQCGLTCARAAGMFHSRQGDRASQTPFREDPLSPPSQTARLHPFRSQQ
ncbi:hypothetical protein SKAU_G00243460 [Synaphobranchus kaupii]|uniref:Uncharacterized protein n=1 Tax=Synaphobranchus kaupii TaxID=118154 RepID=A0A9Q1ITK7_SYNKA|nr:hypothetical protein SKAU_G00243460 [Synaphobranchus kaupii]